MTLEAESLATRPGLVLLYHRVMEAGVDPWALGVTPRHFEQQVRVLVRSYDVVSLPALLERVAGGPGRRPRLAITFDDGYADNLTHAAPALVREGLPATFFLVSGVLGGAEEYWWDELDRLLLRPPALPRHLTLDLADAALVWDLGTSADFSEAEGSRYQRWFAWDEPPTSRHALYVHLWRVCHERPAVRDGLLAQLRDWAGVEPGVRQTHRTLTRDEAAMLAGMDRLEIGAHTARHPNLATLSRAEQRAEIAGSKAELAAITGRPVTTFAYPFGRSEDFTQETVEIVRESGCAVACTNVPGLVTPVTDPLRLPRLFVANWDGPQFERRLATLVGTGRSG